MVCGDLTKGDSRLIFKLFYLYIYEEAENCNFHTCRIHSIDFTNMRIIGYFQLDS